MQKRWTFFSKSLISLILLINLGNCKLLPTDSNTTDALAGSQFMYYDVNDRVNIIQEFHTILEKNYSLYDIKKNRLNLNYETTWAKLIEEEKAIVDPPKDTTHESVLAQAKANLAFFDRIEKMVALLQDTHLSFRPTALLAPVYLGINLIEINGEFYIRSLSQKLMAYQAKTKNNNNFLAFQPGDKIIDINDVPVKEAMESSLKQYSQYISGSSPDFIRKRAIDALTQRHFLYPDQNYVKMTVENKKKQNITLRFDWYFVNSISKRKDVQIVMDELNIKELSDFQLSYNEQLRKWEDKNNSLDTFGYNTNVSLNNIRESKFYVSAEDRDNVIQTGYLHTASSSGVGSVGVIKIFGFEVSLMDEKEAKTNFTNVVFDFVYNLKEMGWPLIIDLRSNVGGNASLPAVVLESITPKNKIFAPATSAFRLTNTIAEFYLDNNISPNNIVDKNWVTFTLGTNAVPAINRALQRPKLNTIHDYYTESFDLSSAIKPERTIEYKENIVALITSECISGCDMFSTLLKTSGRAVLIGSETNGTGAGFAGGDTMIIFKSLYGVGSYYVPNFLFGLPEADSNKKNAPDAYDILNTENRPTKPDIEYRTSLKDITGNNSDWTDISIKTLKELKEKTPSK